MTEPRKTEPLREARTYFLEAAGWGKDFFTLLLNAHSGDTIVTVTEEQRELCERLRQESAFSRKKIAILTKEQFDKAASGACLEQESHTAQGPGVSAAEGVEEGTAQDRPEDRAQDAETLSGPDEAHDQAPERSPPNPRP